jgi:hypothetical protein
MYRKPSRRRDPDRLRSLLLLAGAAPLLMAAALPPEHPSPDRNPWASSPASSTNGAWRSELAQLGTPVSDAELGEMRGKYITPDAVSFFGISMLTSWQDQNGVTTVARLTFNVDFLVPPGGSAPVPTIMVDWMREGDPDMDVRGTSNGYVAFAVTPDQVLPIGALNTLQGAGQANVVAGADNVVGNTLRFAVVPRTALPAMTGNGQSPITNSLNLSFPDGDRLQFRVGDNQIGLIMTGNQGLDSTMQTVGGDLGQMLQQTVLNSDRNNVFNSASIIFGMNDSVRNLDQINADSALSAMKGFGF